MSNPYGLVVFDWEGTIADTVGQIIHSVTDEADKLGLGKVAPISVNKYVSLGLDQAIRKSYPMSSNSQQTQLMEAVQQALFSQNAQLRLVPGVVDFIKTLQGAKVNLALATNKGQFSLTRALQTTGLESFFKVTRCAGLVPAKPCPQMLEEIMVVFNQDAAGTLMIGDSITDMEMASRINVDAIGIDIYNQHEVDLKTAGAKVVFQDYWQLAGYLGF
ncbi:MAG: HAD-IA family hydrolase [Legionella sp.]|nr:HAD-IA family hydrolase [Legionella sp.]